MVSPLQHKGMMVLKEQVSKKNDKCQQVNKLTPFTLASAFSLVDTRRKRLIVRLKANISIPEIDLIFCLPLRGLI
jgi:hypothetical protein